MSLFDTAPPPAPLAEQLRPRTLADVVGQTSILGEGQALPGLLAAGQCPSLILWGPPGCGKTTLARLVAAAYSGDLEQLSAVTSGVADLKAVFQRATQRRREGVRTVLFVDEIHRFNRSQQDAFLPHVENGTLVLLGATTENPSFELNAALLSRCRLVVLERLSLDALEQLLQRAERHTGTVLPLTSEARRLLCALSDGDGRYLLSRAEELFTLAEASPFDEKTLLPHLQRRAAVYDKTGENHYNLISALHKALRGSDGDAALYWFCRMLEGGEDADYIARRLVRFASEDVALADPDAVPRALAGWETYQRLGSPEGELALAGVVLYLAAAPKSNAVYTAYKAARRAAQCTGSLPPPKHILNAPTKMMKDLGYGADYQYDHDTKDGISGQNYFPDGMARAVYYQPKERGFERDMQRRLAYFARFRQDGAAQ